MNLWLTKLTHFCARQSWRGEETRQTSIPYSTPQMATRGRTGTPPRPSIWLAGAHAGISREHDWKQEQPGLQPALTGDSSIRGGV